MALRCDRIIPQSMTLHALPRVMRAALACARTHKVTIARDVDVHNVARSEVLVKVTHAGVNRVDVAATRLDYATAVYAKANDEANDTRWIPGREFAGVVVARGDDAREVAIGERCYGATAPTTRRGAFAEYVCVPSHAIARTPEDVSDREASAIAFAALTAHRALVDRGKVKAGERALIVGGGGAVGTCAIALARGRGVKASATAREIHHARLRMMGCERVVDYTSEKQALRMTAEREAWAPFDVAVDCVGTRASEGQAMDLLKLGVGRYVSLHGDLGRMIGDERGMFVGAVKAFTEYARKKTLSRLQRDVGYEQAVMRLDPDAMVEIGRLVASGELRVPVGAVVEFDEIERAFDLVSDASSGGKVVVRIAEDSWMQ